MKHILLLISMMMRLPAKVRTLACNAAAAATAKRSLAILVNEQPWTAEGEWKELCKYGVHTHSLGRQKVDRESVEKMQAALNEDRERKGANWRGVPIFIGHPRGVKNPTGDKARIGGVMEMRAGADGPEVKIAWNKKGQENAQEGYHVYPSPGWFFEKLPGGIIRPEELDHVGMTNEPNIEGVQPWTNEQSDETDPNHNNPDTTMLKKLAQALGLAENSTEDAALAEVQRIKTDAGKLAAAETAANAAQTQLTQQKTLAANETTARTTAENELKAARTAHAKTLLDIAVNDGRITMADRPTHEAAFEADFDKAVTALAAIKKGTMSTNALEVDVAGARRAIATNQDARESLQVAVNERMRARGETYDQAWAASKKDPELKKLHEKLNEKAEEKKA